jgi:cytochrome c2
MFVLPRRRDTDSKDASFLKSLTYFELLQYGLWIVADVLLYLGLSWALSLRLLANVFYYALFVPYAWWRAPQSPAFRHRVLVPVSTLAIAAMALSFTPAMRHRNTASAASAPAAESLSFMQGGRQVRSVSLSQLSQTLKVEEIAAFDPYYQHNKRWRAVSIEQLMQAGFKREPSTLVDDEFVLRAEDGFAAYFPGRRLLEGGAYVAIADLDQSEWEPIGPRKDNPGPFYLVWTKPDQLDLETHARPWQMASIEIVEFDSQFPHVRPVGATIPQSAIRGFETFRVQCLPCHAINRSGGRVGPELNVPRNILEYRDPSVVEAFIKNPLEFRYTVMPAHPNMTQSDLKDLIAYFQVMKTQKNDKDAPKGQEH